MEADPQPLGSFRSGSGRRPAATHSFAGRHRAKALADTGLSAFYGNQSDRQLDRGNPQKKTTFKTPIHSHIGLFAGACFNYAARYGIDAVYRSGKAVSKAKGRAGESKGKSCRAANAAALHL